MRRFGTVFTLVILCSCKSNERHADAEDSLSITGPDTTGLVMTRLDSNLMVAQQNLAADSSENNFIWFGRRLGYLGRFQDVIDAYSGALIKFPNSYKILRHRGHRFISLRQFDLAVRDLEKAATLVKGKPLETEPDGQPNKLNKPLTTTQFNIYYHLGLAHYLRSDFASAEIAWEECMTYSTNDDLKVATTDWLYMTYRRLGDTKAAEKLLSGITDKMTIIENDSYYKRLRMYQGKIAPDSLLNVGPDQEDPDLALATQGYGVGNWYYYNGEIKKAIEIFEKVVAGKHKSAFGYIAAETDLMRLKK